MIFFFDTETFPIRPGRQAPRVVCVQSTAAGIELRDPGLDRLEAALRSDTIVGHNVAYDAACSIATRPRLLEPWLRAYDEDRVECTLVREKLLRIAKGTIDRMRAFDLKSVAEAYGIPHDFHDDDKAGDGVRVEYGRLDGVPVERWPADARRYALADLVVADVYAAQGTDNALEDQHRQARADFWLQVMRCRGMRTDPEAVAAFAERVEIEHAEHRARLQAAGIVRSDGSRDTKAAARHMRAVCAEKGLPVALTKTGKRLESDDLRYTALDADQCAATADPLLISYARFGSVGNLRARAARLAAAGTLPIQPSFDVLKKTGRTSSSKGRAGLAFGDQVQNLNREPGLRECYVARPGCVLISVDWSGAELHSLAQVCTWMGLDSELAKVLRAGRDAHLHFACMQNGWDYEWAAEQLKGGPDRKLVKTGRQWAKPFNFGFPGGLGIEKFRMFAAKAYGIELTDEQAREGKGSWMRTYPEMFDYFAHINALIDSGLALRHFRSNRLRGDLRYTAAANSYFQGHTADMAKDAGWRLLKAIFSGALEGRLWNFIHDEFILEAPEGVAHEVAMEVVRIMEDAGREWCPDVPCPAEPAISRRWRKGAEPEWRDGRLIPWEDRPMPESDVEKIRETLDSDGNLTYLSWQLGYEVERMKEAA